MRALAGWGWKRGSLPPFLPSRPASSGPGEAWGKAGSCAPSPPFCAWLGSVGRKQQSPLPSFARPTPGWGSGLRQSRGSRVRRSIRRCGQLRERNAALLGGGSFFWAGGPPLLSLGRFLPDLQDYTSHASQASLAGLKGSSGTGRAESTRGWMEKRSASSLFPAPGILVAEEGRDSPAKASRRGIGTTPD